ncbi:MAG: hypothetical protein WBP43_04960 [Chitinophagales bacterium]
MKFNAFVLNWISTSTYIAIPAFIISNLFFNRLFTAPSFVEEYGFPFCFYRQFKGDMAGQHGFDGVNLFYDLLIVWIIVVLIIGTVQLLRKKNAAKNA